MQGALIGMILAIAVAGFGFYLIGAGSDSAGTVTNAGDLLGDTDGDGTADLQDTCSCTADNTRRTYRDTEYCVSNIPSDEFSSLRNAIQDYDIAEGLKENPLPEVEGNVLYRNRVCQEAIVRGDWPT